MASTKKPEEMIRFFTRMMVDDDAIVIAPHQAEFGPRERDFLEGLRRIPAAISAPPGITNPFQYILGRGRGRWVMAWIPEKD